LAIYNHAKIVPIRGEEHLKSIYDVGRAMNEIKAEHKNLAFIPKDVAIHRPAADSPLKWKLVKGEWVPR